MGYGSCKLHGGATPNGIKAAEKQKVLARMATMGLPIQVSPEEALEWLVHASAGHVAWLHQEVRRTEDVASPKADVLIQLYSQERDRLAEVVRTALSQGIAERRVRVAERYGGVLGGVIRGVLDNLDLTPEQRARAQDVVRAQLEAFTGPGPMSELGANTGLG